MTPRRQSEVAQRGSSARGKAIRRLIELHREEFYAIYDEERELAGLVLDHFTRRWVLKPDDTADEDVDAQIGRINERQRGLPPSERLFIDRADWELLT